MLHALFKYFFSLNNQSFISIICGLKGLPLWISLIYKHYKILDGYLINKFN